MLMTKELAIMILSGDVLATTEQTHEAVKMEVEALWERKTARWIKPTGMMPPEHHGHYECSECGTWAGRNWLRPWKVALTRLCPGCGAKMEGTDDERSD